MKAGTLGRWRDSLHQPGEELKQNQTTATRKTAAFSNAPKFRGHRYVPPTNVKGTVTRSPRLRGHKPSGGFQVVWTQSQAGRPLPPQP